MLLISMHLKKIILWINNIKKIGIIDNASLRYRCRYLEWTHFYLHSCNYKKRHYASV